MLDTALQRRGEALEDSPLQVRQGWWPWSPAAGLVPGNLFSHKHAVSCPPPGQPSQNPQVHSPGAGASPALPGGHSIWESLGLALQFSEKKKKKKGKSPSPLARVRRGTVSPVAA